MTATRAAGRASSRRADPLLFGTVAFLSSELMFFGGLFAAYFTLRAVSAVWPPADVKLEVLEPAIATTLLVTSSITMQRALTRARAGDLDGMRRWVGITIVLGVLFLSSQVRTWLAADFGVSSNAYGTMFYGMTGFHALHVAAGIVLMIVVLGRAARGAYRDGRLSGLEAVTYYWHFVDVVWIALFATIYLIK
ncbi:MAG TPA: heme-copper oxidase subunit III [Actinomycetota bacterium]